MLEVIGYIRFSHPAKSDVRLRKETSPADFEAKLWSPERMTSRFYCFEHLCLPSLSAQTNQHFRICVLASKRMPETYQSKLRRLCRSVPQVSLHFDDVEDETGNVHSLYTNWYENAVNVKLGHTLHFRMDDDDALSNKFIEKCHFYGRRMLPGEALTFPNGYAAGMCDGKPAIINTYEPFIALGLGFLKDSRDLDCSPFRGPGHLKTGRNQTSMSVPMRGAYIYMHHQGSDTIAKQDRKLKKLSDNDAGFGTEPHAAESERLLAKNYPFLAGGRLKEILVNLPKSEALRQKTGTG